MTKSNIDLVEKLVDKSIEAFILSLEIYNKPTIRYRAEGFSFFICNAWELMLKAAILKKGESIYYPDNAMRTLSIRDSIKKIYTDKNTRVRLNLEKIVELRNISTHFITEDYENKYIPLFQACVLNFSNEIKRFHGRNILEALPNCFLMLSAHYEPLTNEEIKLKYPPEIAEKLIQQGNEIDILTKEYDSDKFAIDVRQNLYITKKKKDADFTVSIADGSDNKVAIIKDYKDPNNTHNYSFKTVITVVDAHLKKHGITLAGYDKSFNKYLLSKIISFYDIKQDPKYAYKHIVGNSELYTYSQQFVDFILKEIKSNPNFIPSILKEE